jgi:hypothetical protein
MTLPDTKLDKPDKISYNSLQLCLTIGLKKQVVGLANLLPHTNQAQL